jgi:hypothetical protein
LWKVTNFTLTLNVAATGLTITGQNLCEGGFPGSVSANEPNLVPSGDAKANLAHQRSRTNGDF